MVRKADLVKSITRKKVSGEMEERKEPNMGNKGKTLAEWRVREREAKRRKSLRDPRKRGGKTTPSDIERLKNSHRQSGPQVSGGEPVQRRKTRSGRPPALGLQKGGGERRSRVRNLKRKRKKRTGVRRASQ